jgi:hypothetical protein
MARTITASAFCPPCCEEDDDEFCLEGGFEDTYTVQYTEILSVPAVSVQVYREAPCLWCSDTFQYGSSLRAICLDYSIFQNNKWSINNNFLLWVKSGDQGFPEGNYPIGSGTGTTLIVT